MKKLSLVVAPLLCCSVFAADVSVKPYFKRDGTYVPGHFRTAPDSNPYNNYSTYGNVNPYTGETGRTIPGSNANPFFSSSLHVADEAGMALTEAEIYRLRQEAELARAQAEEARLNYEQRLRIDEIISANPDMPEYRKRQLQMFKLTGGNVEDMVRIANELQAQEIRKAALANPHDSETAGRLSAIAHGKPYMPYANDGYSEGYKWAQRNNIEDQIDCEGNSYSFINGCTAYVDENK